MPIECFFYSLQNHKNIPKKRFQKLRLLVRKCLSYNLEISSIEHNAMQHYYLTMFSLNQ